MKALYAGSFDPFTLGHENIAQKAKKLFKHVVIGIADNIHKKPLFTQRERKEMVPKEFEAVILEGLVSDFVRKEKIDYLVRGLRNSFDIESELSLAQINKELCGIETVYLISDGPYRDIHSKQIQELLHFKQDISKFVPKQTAKYLHDHPPAR